jgi:ELWxxDGT repeat protein
MSMKKIVQGWFIGLVLSWGLWLPALGQITEVKDINITATTTSSNPNRFVTLAGTTYFQAQSDFGLGLWKTNGTVEGTVLVKQLCSDCSAGGSAQAVLLLNGIIYFNGAGELWRSDGTESGTVMIKDINPGVASSNPDYFTVANNTLFFIANDGVTGQELWKTDGTTNGTVLVKDFNPAGNGLNFSPKVLVSFNGALYMAADNGSLGRELWKSDGTTAGTTLVKDLNSSTTSGIRELTVVGSSLYFIADDGTGSTIWKSNGTSGGTIKVSSTVKAYGYEIVSMNGIVYFEGSENADAELYKSDGTSAGTQLVRNINLTDNGYNTDTERSLPNNFKVIGNTLYFIANDGVHGVEVWRSDGTEAGTTLIKDINPGSANGGGSNFVELNGALIFRATNGVDGSELWKSDGTENGTTMVLDIWPGGNSQPTLTMEGTSVIYFSANDGSGRELWKTDGTTNGTVFLKDITTGNNHSYPSEFAALGSSTLFIADDGITGYELWKTDGTDGGTTRLTNSFSSTFTRSDSNTPPPVTFNGKLLFVAITDAHGRELWITNGTTAGTTLVKDIYPGTSDSNPSYLHNSGSTVFFTADDGTNGYELWKTDGTEAGTILVKNIHPTGSGLNRQYDAANMRTSFCTINGITYFGATTPTSGGELWRTDGTEAGTFMVKDIVAGASGGKVFKTVNLNNTLVFSYGGQIWKSDGSDAGTTLLGDFSSTPFPKGPLTVYNDNVYFFGRSDNGRELWKSDGTPAGTVLVKDINPTGDSEPAFSESWMIVFDNMLYFNATDGVHGEELWRTDGTEVGTQMVLDLIAGSSSSYPYKTFVANGTLFFGTSIGPMATKGASCNTLPLSYPADARGVFASTSFYNPNSGVAFLSIQKYGYGTELYKYSPSAVSLPLNTSITSHPSSQIKNLSTSTTFTVTATGTNLTYQWKKDGNNITNANATSYTISSVASADAGSYSVEVSGTCGTITSNAATLSVFATQPSQPTALSINTVTSNGYTVSWTPPGTAPTGYLVVRKPSSTMTSGPVDGTVYVLNASIGAGTVVHVGAANSFEETGLANNTIYYYEVYAYNGSANAATLINYNTTSPITGSSLPAVPVSAAATNVSQTGFTANWAASNAASSYKLDVSPDNFANFVSGYQDKVVSGTSDVVTGLNPGATYQYRVRATSFSGTSGNSSTITQLTKPANPVVVANTPTQTGFTLSWSAITSATSYQIEIDNNTDFSSPEVNTTASSTSITPTTLSSGTTYSARVRAVNATGASENSNAVTQLTLPGTPMLNDPTNISNASFKVSWPAVSGTVANYKLEISTDDFVSFVAGYNPKTISGITEEIVQGLTPATVYKVRVRSVNASGESPNSDLKVVETSQASPIVITYGSPITTGSISISISGGVPPYSSAKIFYRGLTSEDETFLSKAMTAGSTAGTFSSSLTTEILTDDVGLEYYVEVDDDGTLANNKTANNPKFYREFTSGAPLPLEERFGNKLSDYQMFSIPLELADNDIEDIFTLLGTYDKTKWRIFHWNANTQTYLENTAGITKIDRGKGYWLISATSATINTGAADAPQGTSFTLNLKAGWNQIGNPYPFEISWADVLEFNGNPTTVGVLNFFKGASGYTNTQDNFPAYAGAFVHADADVSLTLPTILKNGLGGRKNTNPWSIDNANIDSEEWLVGLQLQKGEQVNQLGAFGMHQEAGVSKDAFDGLMVPRFMDYLEANFYHPEFFTPRFARDVVTTQNTYLWTLTLESGSERELTQLSWEKHALMNTEATLLLIDEAEGIQINMKERSSYTFTLGEKKSVKIFYSRTGEDYQPERLVVGKAYPNPFNETISIPFSVSHAEGNQTIKTSVVDMNGREVSVLANQIYSPGFYELQWNGRDDANQSISAGLYLVKFTTANGTTKVSRIIKH